MKAEQLFLFYKPKQSVLDGIKSACNEPEKVKNVVRVGKLIRITPLLNLYFNQTNDI